MSGPISSLEDFWALEIAPKRRRLKGVGHNVYKYKPNGYLAGRKSKDGRLLWAEFPTSLEAETWVENPPADEDQTSSSEPIHPSSGQTVGSGSPAHPDPTGIGEREPSGASRVPLGPSRLGSDGSHDPEP